MLNDVIEVKKSIKFERLMFFGLTILAILVAYLSPDILNNAVIGGGIFMVLPIPMIYLILVERVSKKVLWSSIFSGFIGILYCVFTGSTGLILTPVVVGFSVLGLVLGYIVRWCFFEILMFK